MKKVVGLLAVTFGLVFIGPVQATETKTIAIIDTAVDSSKFDNIVYEVCFTLKTCPNGKNFMEGLGAANVSNFSVNGITHGSHLTSVVKYIDPNVKIVFIRISDLNVYPKFSAMHSDGRSLERAIEWVSNNSEKYSIDAVSISQARTNFAEGSCPQSSIMESSVKKLLENKVPTFAGSGNDGFKNKIAYPACVPGVHSVGALGPDGNPASYSNINPQVKLFANGCPAYSGNICVKILDFMGIMRAISGTSVATPIIAVRFVNSGLDINTWTQSLTK